MDGIGTCRAQRSSGGPRLPRRKDKADTPRPTPLRIVTMTMRSRCDHLLASLLRSRLHVLVADGADVSGSAPSYARLISTRS
jgi:hypothetical protein